jgi:hypothetical protein
MADLAKYPGKGMMVVYTLETISPGGVAATAGMPSRSAAFPTPAMALSDRPLWQMKGPDVASEERADLRSGFSYARFWFPPVAATPATGGQQTAAPPAPTPITSTGDFWGQVGPQIPAATETERLVNTVDLLERASGSFAGYDLAMGNMAWRISASVYSDLLAGTRQSARQRLTMKADALQAQIKWGEGQLVQGLQEGLWRNRVFTMLKDRGSSSRLNPLMYAEPNNKLGAARADIQKGALRSALNYLTECARLVELNRLDLVIYYSGHQAAEDRREIQE